MENPKDQLAQRIKDANNVLVTVSANPSVDQLSAAIGMTLFLSKLKKHSTTVFSGQVPSTIEFLKPEETIEGNTDSLQDFIISLDKAKADKIRYKVEDTMVKIFITPYRTSIAEDDLVFSKGDFNVDVVIALGVHEKGDLDQAITSHGRILHDATVSTVNIKNGSELGTINWTDPQASSLCEMVVVLTDMLKANSLDAQIATALLTGIVAETERFSNERTSSATMNASAKLMAAGANQQLVATKLEDHTPEPEPEAPAKPSEDEGGGHVSDEATDPDDGALRISHEESKKKEPEAPAEPPKQEPPPPQPPPPPLPPPPEPEPAPEPEPPEEKPIGQIRIDDQGQLAPLSPPEDHPHIETEHRKFLGGPPGGSGQSDVIGGAAGQSLASPPTSDSHMVTEPPSMGGKLTASGEDTDEDTSPLNLPSADQPILSHDSGKTKHDTTPPPESPASESPPSEPQNLVQAAEPPTPPPPPPPAPEPEEAPVIPPPPPPEPKRPEHSSKLPQSFVNTLDEKTLKDIEQATHSPHRTRLANDLADKTLNAIEETVHSPHRAAVPPPPEPIKAEDDAVASPVSFPSLSKPDDKPKAFQYEPHESEPPETTAEEPAPGEQQPKAGDTGPVQDDASTPSATAAPADDAKPDDATPPASADTAAKEQQGTAATEGAADADAARDAVLQAISAGGDGRSSLPAIEALGAADFGVDLHGKGVDPTNAPPSQTKSEAETQAQQARANQTSPNIDIDDNGKITFKQAEENKPQLTDHTSSPHASPQAPPPVPPPLVPPTHES